MTLTIGAIADDFTGATDLATTLVARGYRTRVHFGVPSNPTISELEDYDAVVIGLKTRSAPPKTAVDASLQALSYLRELGCKQIYDKFCATFDSTPQGNIGPVLDALMDHIGTNQTVIVLPFPEAGRTLFSGHLFVDGTPLHETSMRHHPLTPMLDSRISRLLKPQTRKEVAEVHRDVVEQGPSAVRQELTNSNADIFIVDSINRSDLDTVAQATSDHKLVAGGAGLAQSFLPPKGTHGKPSIPVYNGFSAILSGSASTENQEQISHAKKTLPSIKINLDDLRMDFEATISDISAWAKANWNKNPQTPVLIYSVGDPSDVETTHSPTSDAMAQQPTMSAAELTEQALARLSLEFISHGTRRLLVAGGETSGSVTQRLGVTAFDVDSPITPGIAWAAASTQSGEKINILLKSGSLGNREIFTHSWDKLTARTP